MTKKQVIRVFDVYNVKCKPEANMTFNLKKDYTSELKVAKLRYNELHIEIA